MPHSRVAAWVSTEPGRARLVRILKSILGIGLLAALLLWHDNAGKLLKVFRQFEPSYIGALLLISLGLNGISSVKWSLFIHARGIEVSQIQLLKLYLIGKFFNNFLPSMVGGDLARSYLLGRTISSQSQSLASVFLDRATGVVGLTVLATSFALTEPGILLNPIIGPALAAAILGCAVGSVFFYHPSLLLGAIRLMSKAPLVGGLFRKAPQVIHDITYFRRRHRLLFLSLLYALGFHLLASINAYTACLSIGLTPDFTDILVIAPVISLLAIIPVSPGNIGWWEWCFSVLLVNIGASSAEGLAVALTLRAITLLVSAVGGLLFLQHRLTHPATTNR